MPLNDVVSTGIEAVSSWCTPAFLFCFLNLIIGAIYILSTLNPLGKQQSKNDDVPHPQIDRVLPSFLQRLKSMNLSRQPDPDNHMIRTRSETTVKKKAPVRVLKKSASEKAPAEKAEVDQPRPATMREKTAAVEDEAVDARADDFINRFRQQLKLQRLDSILRYKEILDRGRGEN